MRITSAFWTLLLTFGLVLSACGEAQTAGADDGLYDPTAPDGSAFVRFLNMDNDEVTPSLNGKKFDALATKTQSAYFVAPQGTAKIALGGDVMSKEIVEEKFYTAVKSNGSVVWIEDHANNNRAKATIALYNFSSKDDLALKAKEGAVKVYDDVDASAMKARDMNPVKIDFGIYEGEESLIKIEPFIIERGNHYGIIYDGSEVKVITGAIDTTR